MDHMVALDEFCLDAFGVEVPILKLLPEILNLRARAALATRDHRRRARGERQVPKTGRTGAMH